MIIAEAPGGYRLITQPAHAGLSGQLAERWGNDRFAEPSPRAPLVFSAHAHDLGWTTEDLAPRLADSGAPRNFTGYPPAEWIDFYADGVDRVAAIDPYAGLLVSMHASGLRRQRYGLSPSMPAASAAYESFVDEQEARQRELLAGLVESAADHEHVSAEALRGLRTLHETGRPGAAFASGSRVWHHYALLEAWDLLSLALCSSAPPAETDVGSVPVSPGSDRVTVRLHPTDDRAIRVDPFPFTRSPVEVSVPARVLPATEYASERDLWRAYYGATTERLRYTLLE